ncbi:MAG: hypothetical protein KOO63_10385, partial [Bacteroidales bacterium]|nr:hypothetical protein [Candidatus Latescibacterota bacterium]
MDEFELITRNENFEMDFFSFLRSLANSFRVAYITSSRDELQQMCHDKDISDSPFFNIFSNLPLRPFSRDEAIELVTVPSEHEGVPLGSYAEKLIDLAGLFPFYLQMACCSLFDHLTDDPDAEPNWKNVTEMFEEEALPHYSFIWEKFDDSEKSNMSKIASGKSIDRKFHFVNENLVRRGYLIETDAGPLLCSDSFRNFVLRSGDVQTGRGRFSSLLGKFKI